VDEKKEKEKTTMKIPTWAWLAGGGVAAYMLLKHSESKAAAPVPPAAPAKPGVHGLGQAAIMCPPGYQYTQGGCQVANPYGGGYGYGYQGYQANPYAYGYNPYQYMYNQVPQCGAGTYWNGAECVSEYGYAGAYPYGYPQYYGQLAPIAAPVVAPQTAGQLPAGAVPYPNIG